MGQQPSFPELEAGAISENCWSIGGDHAEPNVFGNKNKSRTLPSFGFLGSTLNTARLELAKTGGKTKKKT